MKKTKSHLAIILALSMICTTAVPVMAAETDSEAQVLFEVMEEVQDEISGEDIEEPTQEETGMQEEAPDVTVQEEAQPEPSEPADEGTPVVEEPEEELEAVDDVLPDEEDQDEEEEPEDEYGIATLAVTNGFGQGSDGAWYYYTNGQIDTSVNSVIYGTVNGENGWWYVVGGKVQTSFTGLADYSNENGWYYINNGKVTFDFTGLAKNKNGWYYVEDSKVNFSYNGFASDGSKWWYVEKGTISYNKNSVIQDTGKKINGSSDWWYVVGGEVQTSFTGLADYSNSNGWWYIEKGKVTFSHEGVEHNKNGWFYVKDSKVQFGYNGFGENSNGKWYIESGKVTFGKNSVIQDTTGAIGTKGTWWYVVGSQVQTSFTGLADYSNSNGWWYIEKGQVTFSHEGVEHNKNGWFYVKDSKVQFGYNGFESNSNGKWYIESGKVTFGKNGVIQDTTGVIGTKGTWWYVVGSEVKTGFTGLADYSNSNGWWYINNGKVTFDQETVAQNKNGWYYVKDSKVQFSYNGFAHNSNGWWYIESGKVTFNKNSVIQDTGKKVDGTNGWWYVKGSQVQTSYMGVADYSNSNGWWYVKNGKVDFTFTGVATNSNGMWYVKDGKVDFSKNGTVTIDGSSYTVQNGKVVGTMVVIDGKTYYYDSNGTKVTGWYQMGSKYCYFDRSTGAMAVSTTVDGIKIGSDGYASTTSDDVTKIKTMINARNRYLKVVSSSDSQAVQLQKCFDWVISNGYVRNRYLSQEKNNNPNTWTCVYANDMFNNGKGDCFAEACSFAYLAKECGYTPYVCDDGGHGWVEIYGLVYDPDSARSNYSKYYGTTPSVSGRSYSHRTAI